MSMQIPDYAVFAQMPASARKQSLEMIRRFAGQHSASLFLQVYQFDPDADLREMARQELAKQGITPPTDPTPMTVSGNGGSGSGASFSMTDTTVETDSDAYSFGSVFGDKPFTPDTAIDGGNGRPVQRGPQLANIFTLYRGNSKYLTGERAHLQHRLFGYVLVIGILAAVYAIMWFTFRNIEMEMGDFFSPMQILLMLGVIFGAVSLGAIGLWVWNTRRNRRYETEGQLLLGRVLRAGGQWESDSEGGRSFKVRVDYRVQLPDGTTVDHYGRHTRGDLSGGGLPRPGDPVAVLAIDRDHIRLL